EEQGVALVEPNPDQILHHLGLAVDDDARAAGEVAQWDAVALAVELQLDAVMDDALAPQPLAGPGGGEHVDGALLEDAGADPMLHVVAAAILEHDGLDALGAQDLGE